jgi:hypothetical protein
MMRYMRHNFVNSGKRKIEILHGREKMKMEKG